MRGLLFLELFLKYWFTLLYFIFTFSNSGVDLHIEYCVSYLETEMQSSKATFL
jgi:hypothetical protein